MSGDAIIVMVVAIVVVWGGLALGVVALHRHPDEPEDAD